MVSMADDADEVKLFIGDRCFDDLLSHIAGKYGEKNIQMQTN